MKAVVLNKTGGPNVLKVTEVEDPYPKSDEVLVRTKYSGVNYADLLSRQGFYSWAPKRPYILGFELAGEIEKIGKEVKSLDVGDHVIIGTQSGGYAELISIHADRALPAPDHFSFEESAAFLANWFTVWIALHEMGRVRPGEKLLVHAAAGGVGTAALKLGIVHNMDVYGTASTKEKLDIVKKIGGTQLTYENFDQVLKEKGGVDCVVETIGGSIYKRSFEVLAPMGRIILVGASGIQVNKWNPISWIKALRSIPRVKMNDVIRRTRGFLGLHIGYLGKYPDLIRPAWDELLSVVTEHDLKPVVPKDQIFPMSKVAKAHQLIHNRRNIGKVLLDPIK